MDLPKGDLRPRSQHMPATDNIFVDNAGRTLRIFVEASAVGERPKLIRNLLRHGADVMKDPKDADIYLVDPEAQAGLQFATIWGGDGKVVLNIAWVKRSRSAGKALLEDESWGDLEIRPGDAARKLGGEHRLPTPRSSTPSVNSDVETPVVEGNVGQAAGSLSCLPNIQMNTTPVLQGPAEFSQPLVTIPTYLYNALLDLAKNHSVIPQSVGLPQGGQSPMPAGVFPAQFSSTPFGFPSSAQAVNDGSSLPQAALFASQPNSKPNSSVGLTLRYSKGKRVSSVANAQEDSRPGSPSDADAGTSSSNGHAGGSSRRPGKIFVSDPGEPLRMYVQVELRNRSAVVDAIKANGGLLQTAFEKVDYAILHHLSSSFPGLRAQAVHAEKPVIKAQWIFDCVEQEALLDTKPYSLEDVAYKTKRGRPPGAWTPSTAGRTPPHAAEKKRARKLKERSVSPSTEKKVRKKAKPSPVTFTHDPGLRSPSPPTSIKQLQPGKNSFTQEELEYLAKYVPILLMRDPSMGHMAIGEKLAQKVPSHPAGSWSNQLAKRRDELERWKRTAWRNHRESMAAVKNEPPDVSTPLTPTSSNLPTANASAPQPANPGTTPATKIQEDINFMIAFFVDGGADSLDDEAVFTTLSQLRPSRSAQGWQQFWERYGSQISQVVDEQTRDVTGAPPAAQ